MLAVRCDYAVISYTIVGVIVVVGIIVTVVVVCIIITDGVTLSLVLLSAKS